MQCKRYNILMQLVLRNVFFLDFAREKVSLKTSLDIFQSPLRFGAQCSVKDIYMEDENFLQTKEK